MSIYFHKSFYKSFGTFPLQGDTVRAAIADALSVGYRAFDTAQMYENESEVGEMLDTSSIPKNELLITTKVSIKNFEESQFFKSVETSLNKLRVSQVDVLLLHWPPYGGDIVPSIKLLQQAHERKLAKHIGVSNYTVSMLKTALEILEVPIVTNQVEFHPLLDQSKLLAVSSKLGVPITSYCSLARGKVFQETQLDDIAKHYGRSVSQIVLQWILQKGVATTVMSSKYKNIHDNFAISDFVLSSVDMAKIDRLGSLNYRIVDKQIVPWAPDWD
ncbi:MAG: aldo/keto reductase [Rhodobacteraceae bacterium]|nr:aldo/keto reductase [Paracoccaceae bacterium]